MIPRDATLVDGCRVRVSARHWLRPLATGTIRKRSHVEHGDTTVGGNYLTHYLVEFDDAWEGGGFAVEGIGGQCLLVDETYLELIS